MDWINLLWEEEDDDDVDQPELKIIANLFATRVLRKLS